MEKSKTFIMVKPDGVRRGLIGDIVRRFEQRGFRLVDAKLTDVEVEHAKRHYGEHKHKPFFQELVDYITSGPVFAMIWEAENAVAIGRSMVGATNPVNAASGTIRGDYGTSVENNIVHGSDSEESVAREIASFFGDQVRN